MTTAATDVPFAAAPAAGLPMLSASFEDLVRARFAYARSTESGRLDGSEIATYLEAYRAFEANYGQIVHEAWSSSVEAGAVVTKTLPRSRLLRAIGFRGRTHLHSYTDYVTRRESELLFEVTRIESVATLAGELLHGSSLHVVLTELHTALREIFAAYDMNARETKLDDHYFAETALRIRHRVDGATMLQANLAEQSAQIDYFRGMLVGAAMVGVLGAAAAVAVPRFIDAVWGLDIDNYSTALSFGALAAGAVGAQISVMWRMTAGAYAEIAVFGPENVRRLGRLRPFIGAIFGVVLYFALKAGLLGTRYVPTNASVYFYLVTAFIAGFSERVVPEFLGQRGNELVGPASAPSAQPTRREP